MERALNNIVCIDFETEDSRGASFEYFRDDFKISSLSCAWRDKFTGQVNHWFSTRPDAIRHQLGRLAAGQFYIVAQNLPYEYGVVAAVCPGLVLNWYACTMRLSQIRDGGGDEFNPPELTFEQTIALELGEITEKEASKIQYSGIGLSLEACAKRFLTDTRMHDHKKVAHDWLAEHCGVKKNFGRELHRLPEPLLREYNNADTLVTLLLYEEHVKWAQDQGVDWSPDHRLYLDRARLITSAYLRGIRIDQAALLAYIWELEAEIADIEQKFKDQFQEELREVAYLRRSALEAWAGDPGLKSDLARWNRWYKLQTGELNDQWVELNVGSSKQLAMLFMEVMGMEPQFLTKKGNPSFKTTHLHQWGEGGLILQKRRKRLLVLQQAVNTYIGSLYDGRIHCSVKVSGTRTNRVAGGRV